jgi:hypothetical protein
VPRLGLGAERQLGNDHAAARQRIVQAAVFLRVDDIDTAGNYRDAACLEGSQMSGGIDPTGKTRHDDDSRPAERSREVAAKTPAISRGVACPHDRHHRPLQKLWPADHGQDRRRIVDRGKRARVEGLAPTDYSGASLAQGGEFSLGFGPRYGRDGLRTFTAARKLREHVERRPRRAETAQHRKKADRANRLRATQPQPIETLLRIEFARGQDLPQTFFREIRLSVPVMRRRILEWCRKMINRAIPAMTSAVDLSTTNGAIPALATAATSAASEE